LTFDLNKVISEQKQILCFLINLSGRFGVDDASAFCTGKADSLDGRWMRDLSLMSNL